MRVIERGEVVSSGDGGGGTCHNGKPGQSRDKVLKRESRRVEVREELEGGSGGTCHNDKPGPNAGYGASRYDGGEGEGGRRWKSKTCNRSKPCCVLGEMEAKREERWE